MIQTMTDAARRDRIYIGTGLIVICALGWLYLAQMSAAGGQAASHAMTMPAAQTWNLQTLGLGMLMWVVMMAAMMLPTATPTILSFARLHRQQAAGRGAVAPTWVFVTGYLTVWSGFAVVAALAQWGLHEAALLSSAMGRTGPLAGGALVLAAGLFQWTSLKEACLSKCRSPWSFLMSEWRPGSAGAFVMGLRHGIFCAGCCWALMLLMFAGGVMNLAWMGALALYLLIEKLMPRGSAFSRISGLLLIAGGTAVLVAGMF